MEGLLSLAELGHATQRLVAAKARLLRAIQDADREAELAIQLGAEQKRLHSERTELLALVAEVHADTRRVDAAVEESRRRKEIATRRATTIRDDEYDSAKNSVDKLRARHGLPPLPSVQREVDAAQAQYLEERRRRWSEAGVVERNDLDVNMPGEEAEGELRGVTIGLNGSPYTGKRRGRKPKTPQGTNNNNNNNSNTSNNNNNNNNDDNDNNNEQSTVRTKRPYKRRKNTAEAVYGAEHVETSLPAGRRTLKIKLGSNSNGTSNGTSSIKRNK